MSRNLTLRFTCFLFFSLLIKPLPAQHHTADSKLDSYVEQVSELSARARANVYFTNVQSIFNGVQVSFVNVGTGNLTFLRRDIVTSGRMPIVFARVYDSASKGTLEFGSGWRLSALETISLEGNKAKVSTESGSMIAFVRKDDQSFLLERDYPSDYERLTVTGPETIQAILRTGMIKEFRKSGDLFMLAKITDRNGNEVRLSYEKGRLTKIENSTHFLTVTRNAKGRISSVQDDGGRNIQYFYDKKGRLSEMDDMAGQAWVYSYYDDNRLRAAWDPLHRLNFSVSFDKKDQVHQLQLPAGVMQFSYDPLLHMTTVSDRKQLVSRFVQNEEGITTRVINALGEETSVGLDENRNVTSLSRNGEIIDKMEYDQQHRLMTRTSITDSGVVDWSYSYDPATGLLSGIRSNTQEQTFAYDNRGNLITASLNDGNHIYGYSPDGLLSDISVGGKTLKLAQNGDGQIISAVQGNDAISMLYKTGGELSEATFPGRLKAGYSYSPSGLRAKLSFSDGRSSEYSYDPAGNLTGSKVFDKQGKQVNGQQLAMNDSYQLVRWTLFNGTETSYQYDPNGNLTSIKKGQQTTRFEYDSLNRLIAVVTAEGERLAYDYQPGERSLVEQHQHSAVLVEDLRDTGLTFGQPLQITATRPVTGIFGSVRFSENLGAFQLSNGDGSEIIRPQANLEAALKKMFVFDPSVLPASLRSGFNIPFNTMFMPAEYVSINCCPECFYDSGWDCPPCFEPPTPRPILTAIRPSSAQINQIVVPVVLDGTFNDASVSVNVTTGSGITASDGTVFTQADGSQHANAIFTFDNTMTSGGHNVSVSDSGGTSGVQTFSVSCPTGVDLFTLIPIPLERVYPDNKTGVGADAIMRATPVTTNWNGSPIDESLSETSNDCPPVASTACRSSAGFTVGIQGQAPNLFEDFHTNQLIANMLTSGHCSAVCRQVLSACGHVVGTFTIIKTFTADTINGDPVTRVTVDKFPVNQP